jgi:hypothetical protein
MKLRARIAWVVGVTVLTLTTVSVAQEQMATAPDSTAAAPAESPAPASTIPESPSPTVEAVTFSDISDAVPGKYFDAATTAPDANNPNRLIIGFHTGFDADTWTNNTFTASTAAFHRGAAMDTLSFLIEAPPGFYIARITYTQRGTGALSRTGAATGGANWVVDGMAADLGLFHANPTVSGTVDLTGQNKIIVPVSITIGVFTFATPQLGAATIAVTSAEVLVELEPQVP